MAKEALLVNVHDDMGMLIKEILSCIFHRSSVVGMVLQSCAQLQQYNSHDISSR
jgi:hypothetical protein